MAELIDRPEYLRQLIQNRDVDLVKIVTGIRRCGKSSLLELYHQYLLEQGVAESHIIHMNLESLRYRTLSDYLAFYDYVSQMIPDSGKTYLIFDELQAVSHWEKAIESFRLDYDVDIYITGSNAYLLSGELATLLSGRYVEINMLPLSFEEFCQMNDGGDRDALLGAYMRNGGYPYLVKLADDSEKVDMYLEGIYNTILVKDIEERQRRREIDPNKRKINDLSLLKNISKFLASSVGSPISMKSIADYITSGGRSISQATVSDYVEALVEPYIFYPVERYDVLGKQLLKSNWKMYIVDLGIRRYLLPRKRYDLGASLENVIFLELLRRGYRVNIGKVGTTEVDFVARKNEDIFYYQVTASMTEESTFEREMAPLRAIQDNYPKYVITLDRYTLGNYEGIQVIHAVDWLLGN